MNLPNRNQTGTMRHSKLSSCGTFPLPILLLLLLLLTGACAPDRPEEQQSVRVGAERLFTDYYHLVEGKRVGLITNHSAVVNGEHVADLLHADPGIKLVALFGPEHGIRGTADAGEAVAHGVDEVTGVPAWSLYGEVRRPTPEMLEDVDLLIFDIQDVGARFYTYPITMGRSMISAAEADIPFLVLDRPNPLGGMKIEGAIREDRFQSGIGMYPTPITHGMTVGELALMIRDQGWHENLENLELHIIEMEGWSREMLWSDTGLEWIPPSPNIPDVETAYVYPGTCFLEGTRASEGRGTLQPFLQVGSPHVDAEAVAEALNRKELPGVRFHPVRFVPESIPGMSKEPKLEGLTVQGVRLEVTDAARLEPVAAGIYILQELYNALPEEEKGNFFIERGMQIRAGNEETQQLLEQNEADRIISDWEEDVRRFSELRKDYLIYD